MNIHLFPTFMKKVLTALLTAVFIASATPGVVFAHGGEMHSTAAEAQVHEQKLSIEQLQKIIVLLNEVVALIREKQSLGAPVMSVAAHASSAPVATTSSQHSEGHEPVTASSTAVATTTETFAIEVEEHDGKTHVHVRYVDKPEDMFFVDAPMTNESVLIADIAKHTGFPAAVIKPALVYFR